MTFNIAPSQGKCVFKMKQEMDNETLQAALKVVPSTIKTEASGNMSIERIQEIKDFGLDYISVGAITHSAPCADFSLLFDWDSEE